MDLIKDIENSFIEDTVNDIGKTAMLQAKKYFDSRWTVTADFIWDVVKHEFDRLDLKGYTVRAVPYENPYQVTITYKHVLKTFKIEYGV
jgi:hypothetical protein